MILKSVKSEKGVRVINDLREIVKSQLRVEDKLYIHPLPELPSWADRNYWIGRTCYNPRKFICNCSEQDNLLHFYSGNDIRILCRHLIKEILTPSLKKYCDELTLILLEGELKFGQQELIKIQDGDDFYLIGTGNDKWISVYIKEGKWRKFAYSKYKRRWAYNSAPAKASEIEDIISLL